MRELYKIEIDGKQYVGYILQRYSKDVVVLRCDTCDFLVQTKKLKRN